MVFLSVNYSTSCYIYLSRLITNLLIKRVGKNVVVQQIGNITVCSRSI